MIIDELIYDDIAHRIELEIIQNSPFKIPEQ